MTIYSKFPEIVTVPANDLIQRSSPDVAPARSAIVIPCYNEAERLDAAAFITYLDANAEVSFVFVDDGSADETLDRLLGLQVARPDQVEVLSLTKNSGKAEAVRQGLLYASTSGAQYIGYWDADLATPLDAINDFSRVMDRVGDLQVVFGSRRQLLGHKIQRTLSRRAVSRVCAQLARLAVRLPIGDTQCGAKLLRNTPELCRALSQPFTAGWLFDVELFTRISNATENRRQAFFEQPLVEWSEIAGSKVSAKAILRSGLCMLRLIAENRLGLPVAATVEADVRAVVYTAPTSDRLVA